MSHDQKDGRRADIKGGQAREKQWGGKGLSAQRGRARSRAHMDQGTGARKQHGARGGGGRWALHLLLTHVPISCPLQQREGGRALDRETSLTEAEPGRAE